MLFPYVDAVLVAVEGLAQKHWGALGDARSRAAYVAGCRWMLRSRMVR